jgi:adenylate cyclase
MSEMATRARLILNPGTSDSCEVAVRDVIYVGRECAGAPEDQRLVVDDLSVSRNHLEIRVRERGLAYVVDTSTNGTRVNGIRIERAVPTTLSSGDRLTVGSVELEFQSTSPLADLPFTSFQTIRSVTNADFVMVVADIVGFSTASHAMPSRLVMESLDVLLAEFRTLLTRYRGTLSNYVGDAFFAVWELDSVPNAPELAIEFVVAAAQRLDEIAPSIAFRGVDGQTLRMGWGVARGDAAVSSLTGVLLGVVGDAANLAFRLSGLAARQGRSEVLVTEAFYQAAVQRFPFGEPESVEVKSWHDPVQVRGLRLPTPPT